MADIGYDRYIGYELCHPLPQVDGVTAGIEFADLNARLAAEYFGSLVREIEAEHIAARMAERVSS